MVKSRSSGVLDLSFQRNKSVPCTTVRSSKNRPHRLPARNKIRNKREEIFAPVDHNKTKPLPDVKPSPSTTCITFGNNDVKFHPSPSLNVTLRSSVPTKFNGFVKMERMNFGEAQITKSKEELPLRITKLGDSSSDSEHSSFDNNERTINYVKSVAMKFEDKDNLEDVKPKTFSLDLSIDNMVTSVPMKKSNHKSWLYARNQFRNTQLKGSNSNCFSKPAEEFHYLTTEGHRKFVNYLTHQLK